MTARARRCPPTAQSLRNRRTALVAGIHVARQETAEAARFVAEDLRVLDRSRRSLQTGMRVLKASAVAAGVVWSLNATSRAGRGSRLMTIALSLFSAIRALHQVRTFLTHHLPPPEIQGHEYE